MGFLSRAQDSYQCGAYLSDGWSLFEIVDRASNLLTLENCKTFERHTRNLTDITVPGLMGTRCEWRVVRRAPAAPDFVDP